MDKTPNLSGLQFNRITVLSKHEKTPNKGWKWKCKCACGNFMYVLTYRLTARMITSCGCARRENVSRATIRRNKTHQMSKTREYKIWQGIKKRVGNKNAFAYESYGGRGISMSEDWESFEKFFEDLGVCPPGFTLDRIDNNKGYSRENCRWASYTTQANNKRNNRILEIFGEKMTMAQAAAKFNVNYKNLHHRLKLGWTPEKAVTTPKMKNQFVFA